MLQQALSTRFVRNALGHQCLADLAERRQRQQQDKQQDKQNAKQHEGQQQEQQQDRPAALPGKAQLQFQASRNLGWGRASA